MQYISASNSVEMFLTYAIQRDQRWEPSIKVYF